MGKGGARAIQIKMRMEGEEENVNFRLCWMPGWVSIWGVGVVGWQRLWMAESESCLTCFGRCFGWSLITHFVL